MTVELKNDLAIKGTLHSVDQYLNIKLNNTRVVNEQKYPHMVRTVDAVPLDRNLFCLGSGQAQWERSGMISDSTFHLPLSGLG